MVRAWLAGEMESEGICKLGLAACSFIHNKEEPKVVSTYVQCGALR